MGNPRDLACGASSKSERGWCGYPAGWGTDHPGEGRCRKHGGSTETQRKGAALSAARKHLAASVKTFGLPKDVSPQQALLDEVQWTAGHVEWLREQVQELETNELIWGLSKVEHKNATEFAGTDIAESAHIHVLVELYQRERRHLVDVCRIAIAAGIEEQRVKLAERQGNILAAALGRLFDDLSLSADQRTRLPELIPVMFGMIREQWALN